MPRERPFADCGSESDAGEQVEALVVPAVTADGSKSGEHVDLPGQLKLCVKLQLGLAQRGAGNALALDRAEATGFTHRYLDRITLQAGAVQDAGGQAQAALLAQVNGFGLDVQAQGRLPFAGAAGVVQHVAGVEGAAQHRIELVAQVGDRHPG